MVIVSLHSCYFEQENILIGAWEGGNYKTKSPYLQMCKWRAKQKKYKTNSCYVDIDWKVNIL